MNGQRGQRLSSALLTEFIALPIARLDRYEFVLTYYFLEVNGFSMQIVIPVSVFGERFRRAGYSVPKPLIKLTANRSLLMLSKCFPGI